MSEKFARFCLKHKVLGRIIAFLMYAIPFTVIFYVFGAGVSAYVIAYCVIAVVTIFMTSAVPAVLTTPALKMLTDKCDPYPLLEACDEILQYVKLPNEILTATLNRCVALAFIGRHQENYDILKSIAIDSYNGLPATIKYTYYNNLADAALTLDDIETAEFAFAKSKECHSAIKNKKLYAQYADANNFLQVVFCIKRGEFESALALLKGVDTASVSRSVNVAYLYAKINIGLGKLERAKTDLEYVIATGNKLCCVEEAKRLLREISQ